MTEENWSLSSGWDAGLAARVWGQGGLGARAGVWGAWGLWLGFGGLEAYGSALGAWIQAGGRSSLHLALSTLQATCPSVIRV